MGFFFVGDGGNDIKLWIKTSYGFAFCNAAN